MVAIMYARIVIDAIIGTGDKVFDYIIPDNLDEKVRIGSRVFVPFGPRETEGFVLDIKDSTDVDPTKLKEVLKSPDEFVAIKPEFLAIAPAICDKFKLRLIDVLRLFVPSMVRGRKRTRKVENKEIKSLEIAKKQITLTDAQRSVVDEVLGNVHAGSSRKGVRGEAPPPLKSPLEGVGGGISQVFLLHGVTGSGKTEVYMHIIEQMLQQGKSAIMLVPEIGLTPQVLGSFRARFGDTVAMIHSGLSPTERYDQWLRLHNQEAKIAIGARSAIFAPLENLGIIIIDEEHDTSYFSESNPRFSTHEIAKLRGTYNKCPLLLGSATPCIESMNCMCCNDYKLLKLDRRVNDLAMPKIQIIDMIAEIRGGNGGLFAGDLMNALIKVVENNKQAMIFLNRRGFASNVTCKQCGWVAYCDNCDVSLVWHKDDNLLKCHYCAARFTKATTCKKCTSSQLRYGYTGTQKVVEELENIFPNTKIFRLDADNTKTKDSLVTILNDFAKTVPAILVGTQMIAKGHDFPNVDVVGIIDADNSLHFSDFRAAERTFSLITQVAGRAGRHKNNKNTKTELPDAIVMDGDESEGHKTIDIETSRGVRDEAPHPSQRRPLEGASMGVVNINDNNENEPTVFLQTYKPNHYVYRFAANYDYNNFFEKELNTRMTTKYPPYATIVRILVTGEVDEPIKKYIEKILTKLRTRQNDFIYLGAMKSPLGRIQNKFRYQILARFNRNIEQDMINFMHDVVNSEDKKKILVFLEINPQSLS